MNEELQSTNEELESINIELRQRSDELNAANSFMGGIFAGLPEGVVVLDRDLVVLIWNHRAEDLWGLRTDEVEGKHFLNLDIGLPVDELKQPIRACVNGETSQELSLNATNRRGKPIRCDVTVSQLAEKDAQVRGVILLMRESKIDSGTT